LAADYSVGYYAYVASRLHSHANPRPFYSATAYADFAYIVQRLEKCFQSMVVDFARSFRLVHTRSVCLTMTPAPIGAALRSIWSEFRMLDIMDARRASIEFLPRMEKLGEFPRVEMS
jgi:hypothetical protein